MKLPKGSRRWRRFELGGMEWTIFLLPPDLLERIAGASVEGLCEFEQNQIYIDKTLPLDRRYFVAFHEILHAATSCPGFGTLLTGIFGVDDEAEASAIEERYVTTVIPMYFSALRSAKMIVVK